MVTSGSINFLDADPKVASVAGYLASLPLNFFGNRRFSFKSNGNFWTAAWRFFVLHAVNIFVTAAAMSAAVDCFHLHYLLGVIGAIVFVPLASFLAMHFWVFEQKHSREF